MSYKALQAALKAFKAEGLTTVKLNGTKASLQAEYDRLTADAETVTETVTETAPEVTPLVTFHSFKEILRQRKPLYTFRKAHGFLIVKPEKRYDQLTPAEWLGDTLAFLDDYIIYDEDDYIAA
jgi:hypothetical protein